ncbi:MAG TPA: cellulose binding domain-containing protein [Actinocrinis sp.]|jgi:O-glycosyl hydrolase
MITMRKAGTSQARAALAVAAVLAVSSLAVVGQAHRAYAADSATINASSTFQTINGFGASEAFGQAATVMDASSSVQQQVLADLYSPTTGAGLNILRNEVSADSGDTIEPTAPSSPTATPAYASLASINQDMGQLWFAQQIKSLYGVTNVFADTWSAPGFMKTNNSPDNGGWVNSTWQQAYANYLVQYAEDYSAAGIPLTYIGPMNEPEFSASYDSMTPTPAQAASMIDTLGPTLASSGLSTQVDCCADEGWGTAAQYASAIEGDSTASKYAALFTSHGYTAAPTSPMPGWTKPIWETEWSTFETFDPAWDDNTDASGMSWAQHIYTGLTSANLNAFLYWWGSTTTSSNGDNEGLVEINGSTVTPTGRLWAFANYSRYIHPGAVRIATTTTNSGLDISAFKNTDGTIAVVVLNTATSADTVNYALSGTSFTGGSATPVVSDSSSNAAAQSPIAVSGGAFSATAPARSLVTYVITPGTSTGSPSASASASPSTSPSASHSASPSASPSSSPSSSPSAGGCTVTYSTTSQWTGGFTANVVVANSGTAPINGWTVGFTFAGDQKVTNAWNAVVAQSGETVSAVNESYNSTISAGGNTSFGFQGTWTNSDAVPTAFTVNGKACTVG